MKRSVLGRPGSDLLFQALRLSTSAQRTLTAEFGWDQADAHTCQNVGWT